MVLSSQATLVKAQTVCESCYQRVNVDVDLTSIELKELPADFAEPYSVKLSDGTELKLRLFRVKDEIKVAEAEKKQLWMKRNHSTNTIWFLQR